jgi:hypothetical protein
MKIQILSTPSCSHRRGAAALVDEVVLALAPGAEVESLSIATLEQAARHRFPGSPTIRVDGLDIDPRPPPGVGLG